MAFIDNHQEIIRKKVEQAKGPLTRFALIEITRVVFDARTITQFTHHLQIKFSSLFDTFRFLKSAVSSEIGNLIHQIRLNIRDRII